MSLGEHRGPAEAGVLGLDDLAVGCDSERLYLAAPALGVRIEAWALHALNLRHHTPALARLITEISRGQYAQVTDFESGGRPGAAVPAAAARGVVGRWWSCRSSLPGAGWCVVGAGGWRPWGSADDGTHGADMMTAMVTLSVTSSHIIIITGRWVWL